MTIVKKLDFAQIPPEFIEVEIRFNVSLMIHYHLACLDR